MTTTDAAAARTRMARQVWADLNAPQKRIDPKYFYDERGSRLFDEITRLPEYYLTRTERALLDQHANTIIDSHAIRTVVELGAGSGDKTRLLLEPLVDRNTNPTYVPVDISETYLDNIEQRLRSGYPTLNIRPCLADITKRIELPTDLARPMLIAFLGSTIGNFELIDAVALLARSAAAMTKQDRLLIGFDLKKDVAVLEAAYNDAAGITAAFNLNVLDVLNHEIDANFDPRKFRHHAFYNTELGCIEMHLASLEPQQVRIGAFGSIHFKAGETIHTEVSCKYDRAQVEDMLSSAGLKLEQWLQDEPAQFALVIAHLP